jgi:hypothetical protein
VLDAALERAENEPQARGWLHRLFGGTTMTVMIRTAAVAAVLAFVAFIGYQVSNLSNIGDLPSPSPSASGEPSPSAAPSLPPESAEPSAEPSPASLVFRLLGGGEAGRVHLVTVLDDGRVVTSDPFGATPLLERRLTEAGVQLVRDELESTALTGTSADYSPVPHPGVEPPGYGGAGPSLEVGQPGGESVVISWFLFGDTEPGYFQPQPEAEALEALATRLSTLDAWLPASAWADATGAPYEPESYRIYIYSQQWGGSLDELPVESSTVSWPLIDGADAFGDAVERVSQGTAEGDTPPLCRAMSSQEAAPVIEALEAAGATPNTFIPGTSMALGHRATSRLVTVTFEPILPLADPDCGVEAAF